jgi:hypothetical protein
MTQIIRTFFIFLLVISCVQADKLNITVDQSTISLPYWQAKKIHYGAVIIVRGGQQPEWSQLLADFAKQLARTGWSSVLLNCDKGTTLPWIDQIPEVISTLRQNKNRRIILIHYGEQLNQSLDYFSKPQSKMINGLVMLSAYDLDNKSDSSVKLRFPLFDIAGQFDYDMVLSQMQYRGKEFKDRNYMAVEMPGAQHDYEYSKKLLVAYIHGWMAKLPEFVPQPRPIQASYIPPVYASDSQIAVLSDSDWSGFIDNPKSPE